jgi:hypothetical protein
VVLGELDNFSLWGLIWSTVQVVLGGLGKLDNFPLWGVDLEHCVAGFG